MVGYQNRHMSVNAGRLIDDWSIASQAMSATWLLRPRWTDSFWTFKWSWRPYVQSSQQHALGNRYEMHIIGIRRWDCNYWRPSNDIGADTHLHYEAYSVFYPHPFLMLKNLLPSQLSS